MLKNTSFLFGAKIGGYAIRLAVPYVLVRHLSQVGYGTYQQFFLVEIMIALLFQLGANQALYYFVPRDETNGGRYFLNSVVLNLAIFAVVFGTLSFFRAPVATLVNIPVIDEQFVLLAIYTVFVMLIGAADCYLIVRQRVVSAGLIEIGGQVLVSTATVVVAIMTGDLGAIILVTVAGRGVHLLIAFGVVHRLLGVFRSLPDWSVFAEQFRHGVPLGLAGACWMLGSTLHKFVASAIYGTETYAIYAAGTFEIPVFALFLQSLASVTLGQFARLQQAGDQPGIEELWRKVMTWLQALVVPAILIFLVLSRPLIEFVFPDFEGAAEIFRINTIANLAMLWNAQLVLRAMGRNDVTLWVYVPVTIVSAGAFWLGDRLGGMVGIIWAQAVMLVAGRLVALAVLNRILSRPLPWVVGPGAVFAFYRDLGGRARQWKDTRSPR